MAKDMLDAICAAEEEASRRESEAKAQLEQTVAAAKKEAEELIAARTAKAAADADAQLAVVLENTQRAQQQAQRDAQGECDKISAAAEKNRPSVIAKAADAILG